MSNINRTNKLISVLLQIFRLSNNKLKNSLFFSIGISIISSFFEFLLLFVFHNFCNNLLGIKFKNLNIPLLNFLNLDAQNTILLSGISLIIVSIIGSLIKISNIYLLKNIAASFGIYFSKRFFKNQVFSGYLEIKTKSLGYLSSIENKSILSISELIALFLGAISALTNAILIIFSMIILSGSKILVVLFTLIFMYIVIVKLSRNKLLNNSRIIEQFITKQINNLNFLLNDFKFINLTGIQRNLVEEYNFIEKKIRYLEAQNNILSIFPKYIIEAIGISSIAFLSILISKNSDDISKIFPTIALIGIGSIRILPSLQMIYTAWADSTTHIAPAETIIMEINNYSKAKQNQQISLERLEMKNSFKLENIYFKYPKSKKEIIKDFSLEIKKGEYIGIVGKSGQGKTTLLDILSGFLRVNKGSFKIDNKEIKYGSHNMKCWQRNIAIVSQDIYIREGNFLNNLVPDQNDYNLERLDEACKTAQIYNFIKQFKYGYHSRIPFKGSNLSGGQKQRLSLARALYYSPSLLILDEYTSSIDSETEKKILSSLKKLKGSITIIVISHKKETLIDCDYIVNLN